jgi:hypothetical protein
MPRNRVQGSSFFQGSVTKIAHRHAAVGEGGVRALLEDDDGGVLVEAPSARSRGRSACAGRRAQLRHEYALREFRDVSIVELVVRS